MTTAGMFYLFAVAATVILGLGVVGLICTPLLRSRRICDESAISHPHTGHRG